VSRSTPQSGTAAARPPALPPCRILVVDDNRDAAFSIAALLRLAGHELATADDGAQALEQAAAFKPDVVVLDIGLPVLDGYEVAARLRSAPGGDALLLLALTGYGQLDDRASAKTAGFDDHFVKPADPDALVERIERWNQQRESGGARTLARRA
jgi:CheY-like chemotaxis protein